MRLPKRFKVHEAAGGCILHHGDRLVVFDHASVVSIPVLGPSDRAGADLPRLEAGECVPAVRAVSPKAFQAASQGSKGEGLVRLTAEAAEACSGEGKGWVRHADPDLAALPDAAEHFRRLYLPPAEGRREVTVALDAEALVKVSRAIGAGGDGVRLRFHIVEETGECCLDHGMIEVRTPREPSGGAFGILMAVAV